MSEQFKDKQRNQKNSSQQVKRPVLLPHAEKVLNNSMVEAIKLQEPSSSSSVSTATSQSKKLQASMYKGKQTQLAPNKQLTLDNFNLTSQVKPHRIPLREIAKRDRELLEIF